MADDLSTMPDFGPTETMPWETAPDAPRWQWGLDQGKTLSEIASRELVRKRRWLVEKNGAQGHYFDALIAELDRVLTERQGE